jgi:hypothetical protein
MKTERNTDKFSCSNKTHSFANGNVYIQLISGLFNVGLGGDCLFPLFNVYCSFIFETFIEKVGNGAPMLLAVATLMEKVRL